jgi:formate-dependent nitrite reductase membrane component NrfD
MSDTFFTSSPHWRWLIVLYFFIGGIAGGAFVIASLLHLFGRIEDRPVVRHGYNVAFLGALVSGLLLTIDLSRPLRFWHMLIRSNVGALMFKSWSPMSVGAWGLLLFGLFATLAALGQRSVRPLGEGVLAKIIAAIGGLLGFFLAGYTGVLLAVTNRPMWADTQWLGLLFLLSGISTAAATLILLSLWRRDAGAGTLSWLTRFDRAALVLELVILVVFVISLGSVARMLVGFWGLVLLLGVVVFGIVIPFVQEKGVPTMGPAVLVLIGGLLLRFAIVFSSDQFSRIVRSGGGGP